MKTNLLVCTCFYALVSCRAIAGSPESLALADSELSASDGITLEEGKAVVLPLREGSVPVISCVGADPYLVYICQDGDDQDHFVVCDTDGSSVDVFDSKSVATQDKGTLLLERKGSELRMSLPRAVVELQLKSWDGWVYLFGENGPDQMSEEGRDGQGISTDHSEAATESPQEPQKKDTDIIVPVPSGGAPTYDPTTLVQSKWVVRLNERGNGKRTVVVANAHVNSGEVERREKRTASRSKAADADSK